MPLLKAKQALNRLPVGAVLEVLATDPGSERDFAVFAQQSGHALLLSESTAPAGDETAAVDARYRYLLRKAQR